MATQKLRALPPPPTKFASLDDVRTYQERLYRALAEFSVPGFSGEIYTSDRPPNDSDGKDGDLWIEHSD